MGKKKVMLVIASKVKAYAKESDMRTSQEALDALSDFVEKIIDAAIVRAKEDGRKTIAAVHIVAEVKED